MQGDGRIVISLQQCLQRWPRGGAHWGARGVSLHMGSAALNRGHVSKASVQDQKELLNNPNQKVFCGWK